MNEKQVTNGEYKTHNLTKKLRIIVTTTMQQT
jgi:hypothetical protein